MANELNIALTDQYYLSCLLKNKDLILQSENYCVSSIGRKIYDSLEKVYKNRLGYSIENITLELSKVYEGVDSQKIQGIRDLNLKLEDYHHYEMEAKKNFLKANLRDNDLQELYTELNSKNKFDKDKIGNILEEARKKITTVLNDSNEEYKSLDKALESLEQKIIDQNNNIAFNSYGDFDLDHLLGGPPVPGEICLVYARPGMGKSLYCLYLLNCMINLRIPVIYINLEMSEVSTMQRLVSHRTGTPYSFFNKRAEFEADTNLMEEQLAIVRGEKEKLKKIKSCKIIDNPSCTREDIEGYVETMKRELDVPFVNVIVDLLSMSPTMKKSSSQRTVSITDGLDEFSASAKQYNYWLLGVIQANRDTEGEKKISKEEDILKMRPELKNLKDSGAWEERARVILSVFRPYYYYEKYMRDFLETQENILEITPLKNSNDNTGKPLKYLMRGESFQLFPYVDPIEEFV